MIEATQKGRGTLRFRDLTLYTVSAILLLDTLAATASAGASSIFWWLFLGLVYFLPFGLISAEMGTTYPEHGGIYAWVRDAFGGRWASRVTWCYWVTNAFWCPAIYILFAAIFSQLFYPDLSLSWQIGIGIALAWITVVINVIALDVGKWVPNIGAVLKGLIFIAIIIGGVLHTLNNGMANPLTFEAMTPSWGTDLQYIPAIIYGMMGFELMSASSDEMRDPGRDIPRAILVSGVLILLFYTLGTFAVLAAIPAEDINLVEGLVDTLLMFFGSSEVGKAFVTTLGIAALYTFFSNGVTWAMGSNRSLAEAAIEGELPRFLGWEHKRNGTPIGASVALGLFSTVSLLMYGYLAGTNEDLFWSLFSFSAVIFLLPYIGMILAFIKMRKVDGARPRPFKVPGGYLAVCLIGGFCITSLILAILLFVYVPGDGIVWNVLLGTIITVIVGDMLIRIAERAKPAR